MAKSLLQLLASVALGVACLRPTSAIETVDDLVVSKYLGRWYQAYGNAYTARTIIRDSTCVAADYGLDQATGNITVINSDREHIPTGELNTISGYAYGVDPSEPGQLKVHLGQVPVDGDYWVVGLGPATFGPDGAYEWAIVSGPEAESLFILVRDVPRFENLYAKKVLGLVHDLGFTGPAKRPQRIVQEGCLPFDPTTLAAGKKRTLGWADFLATSQWNEEAEATYASEMGENAQKLHWNENGLENGSELLEDIATVAASFDPVVPVTALDVDRYIGRWYQAYSSYTVSALLEQNGACVTADYAAREDGEISVVNTARAKSADGELITMEGYAYMEDASQPGKLTVHLDGVPMDAPYWILALGGEEEDGPYSWSIVSDPIRAFLFVLVRDPDTFFGSQGEADLLAKCKDLGFTAFWNSPQKTEQEGCEYPTTAGEDSVKTAAVAEVDDKLTELSPVLKLRGGGLGMKGPLHASCKMTVGFPKRGCEEVSDALVMGAKGMSGFDNCNGGNKCGYTVSKVGDGSLEFVHETSVKHYKDTLTFTFADKGDSCEAEAFSTSQTWYAVLDNSVNYCNLHNLVDAAFQDYKEMDVSDATCTQYSSADCDRY
eukprot:jgi/Undpi1/2473/HiC_scaffold_13.g05852.m1